MEKLILGTVQLGLDYGVNNATGKPTKEKAFEILNLAYQNGIRLLDTAEAYGNATEIIGKYHKSTNHRFEVISKFKVSGNNEINLIKKVNRTLTKLGIEAFWGYLFHSFKDLQNYPALLEPLKKAQQEGKIKHIGVSIYTNEEFRKAIENPFIQLIQLPYNLLDNDVQRGELMAAAKMQGKILHTRSAFLQGLFFKNTNSFSEKLSSLKAPVEQLQAFAENNPEQMAALALQFATSNPLIDQVLIGVDSSEQLAMNLHAIRQNQLSETTKRIINSIAVSDSAMLNPSNWS